MTAASVQLQSRASLSTDSRARNVWAIALGWTLVAIVVRAYWLTRFPSTPVWDGAIYHRTAVRIASGLGFIDSWNNHAPYHPTAFYPVGYPAVLGALYAVFGVHFWIAGVLNVFATSVTAWITITIAHRAFGRWPAHLAGGLFALSPGAMIYSSAFMTEPLSAALLMLTMVSALDHARTGRIGTAIITGLLLGLGGLVRPPALLVAPVVALASSPTWTVRAMLRSLVLVGVACTAVVLPWTARNCRQLDACALVSVNGGSNLFLGTDPEAHGGYRDLHPHEGCDHVFGEVAKDRCYAHIAMDRIEHHPIRWLALAPMKIEQLLSQETSPISYLRAATEGTAFNRNADVWYRVLTGYHRMILGIALIGLIPLATRQRRKKASRESVMIVAVVIAFVIVHVIFFGVDRYHFVFTPLLCILAGAAVRRADDQA